jgi:hypothetical protein
MSKFLNSINKLRVNLLILLITVFAGYTVNAGTPEIIYTYSEFISSGVVTLHAAIKTNGEDATFWYSCYITDYKIWDTSPQYITGDTVISFVETIITEFAKDSILDYWLYAMNGSGTVWSGKQTTSGRDPITSAAVYNLTVDNITTSSFRLQASVKTNGYPCIVNFSWGIESGTQYVIKQISIPPLTNDTVVSYTFADLNPYVTYYTKAFVTDALLGYIGGETREKTLQTLYDSNTVGLTTAMIVSSEPKIAGAHINFGVNTYGHYGYDYALGEHNLPPTAPGIDVRFIGTRLTEGSYIDIKPFYSTTQIDTYKVRLIADPDYYPIKFIWQDLSSKYTGSVILKTSDESIDMRSVTSYSITNPDIVIVRIIAEGPKPTPFFPSIMAKNPTVLPSTGAILASLVNPNGSNGSSWFEWGTSDQYGTATAVQEIPTSFQALDVTDKLEGLSPSTEYHFRTVVQTELGTFYGIDQKFQTGDQTNISDVEIPNDQFKLFQNYPNPFNPTTTITYQIPKADNVTIKVYTLLGREIATLVDEKKSLGKYQVTWDAGMFPSGVYYYRIVTGLGTKTGKLLLLK